MGDLSVVPFMVDRDGWEVEVGVTEEGARVVVRRDGELFADLVLDEAVTLGTVLLTALSRLPLRVKGAGRPSGRAHGNASTYAHGCRCDDCREAHRVAKRQHRAQRVQ